MYLYICILYTRIDNKHKSLDTCMYEYMSICMNNMYM